MADADVWEDVAFGPPAVQTDGEWVDVAFGPKAQEPSFLESVWTGVKKTPGIAYDLVTSIPSGISNLAHLPGDAYNAAVDAKGIISNELFGTPFIPRGTPEESAQRYARAERTLGGVAGLGTGVATWGVGGPLGATAGATGLEKLLQAVGISAPTTPGQDLTRMTEDLGTNLTFGLVAKGAEKAAPIIREKAAALDRKSLGTRQSDYGTASQMRTIETPAAMPETFTKSALDDLLSQGKLGTARDPATLVKLVDKEQRALSKNIDRAVQSYDKNVGIPVYPEFASALDFIYSGKVPANLIPEYMNRLDKLDRGIRSEGGGKLAFLQQQKVATGKSYDLKDAVKADFERAIYDDLKVAIEKAAPQVGPLNAELAKWMTAEPIVKRSLTAAENRSFLSTLGDLPFTTGGIGAAGVMGGLSAGGPGVAVGAGLGLLGKVLKSPTSQATVANLLRKTTGLPFDALGAIPQIAGALPEFPQTGDSPASLAETLSRVTGQAQSGDSAGSIAEVLPKADAEKLSQLLSEQDSSGIATKENVAGKRPNPAATEQTDLNSLLKNTKATGASEYGFMNTLLNEMNMDKKSAQVIEEIKKDPIDHAIMLMESGGDPEAKNPDSSASGLFQLIKSTAKNLGVKDVFNAEENYEGYKKLKAETIEKIGSSDVATIYAAHYLGLPTLQKLLDGKPLTAKQAEQVKDLQTVLIPRLMKIYGGLVEV